MDLLRKGGVLLLIEPPVPGGHQRQHRGRAAVIAGFNAWISFVHRCSEAHDLAFVPVHGGTIVAVRKLS